MGGGQGGLGGRQGGLGCRPGAVGRRAGGDAARHGRCCNLYYAHVSAWLMRGGRRNACCFRQLSKPSVAVPPACNGSRRRMARWLNHNIFRRPIPIICGAVEMAALAAARNAAAVGASSRPDVMSSSTTAPSSGYDASSSGRDMTASGRDTTLSAKPPRAAPKPGEPSCSKWSASWADQPVLVGSRCEYTIGAVKGNLGLCSIFNNFP